MYDVEQIIRDLAIMFKAKLNDKITAINTEKGDFSVNALNANAWFFQHVPSVWNYSTFVVYGFENIDTKDPQEDNMIQECELFFEIVIPDGNENETEAQIYKLLRYARALREVAQENYDCLRGYGKIKVASLSPTAIELNGKSLKASGIKVTASISAR